MYISGCSGDDFMAQSHRHLCNAYCELVDWSLRHDFRKVHRCMRLNHRHITTTPYVLVSEKPAVKALGGTAAMSCCVAE